MKFANRIQGIKPAANQEIIKITQRPEVLSFAVGMPAPEVFPIEELKQITVKVLEESGNQALQYSTTEGYKPLRQQIAVRMNDKFNTSVDAANILIVNGGQQALDFTAKLFLNDGDVVLCESPTYLAALNSFLPYCPRFVEVPTDNEGMIIAELEERLRTVDNIKFIYVIPDFQNPTGKTWSLERRRQFMDIITRYKIPVLEDSPYGELRFEGTMLPALKSFDTKNLVLFTSTFSKTLSPGLRIGWIAAEGICYDKLVLIKQGADLHASSLGQMQISRFIDVYDFDAHIANIVDVYRTRRNAMIQALEEHFSDSITFTRPQGGLFLWVELPESINAAQLLEECLKQEVAFLPGDTFFPNSQITNTLRLNFSYLPAEKIREGIRRLANVFHDLSKSR